MINANVGKGELHIQGHPAEILGELSWVVRSIKAQLENYVSEEHAFELIAKAGQIAVTNEVELEKAVNEINELMNKMKKEDELVSRTMEE